MNVHSQTMLHTHFAFEQEADLARESGPSSFRILIVNEDMRSADTLKRTLGDLGYDATFTAYSARRALVAAVDFSPSIAIVDLELPDMTGYQLASRFRAHAKKYVRQVPLLAIAELPLYCNDQLTRAAGFLGCLDKPVEAFALADVLRKLQTGEPS